MDLRRFNTFTRALSNGNSRRDTLALLGGLLAFPFAALPAEAKKKKKKITVRLLQQPVHQGAQEEARPVSPVRRDARRLPVVASTAWFSAAAATGPRLHGWRAER